MSIDVNDIGGPQADSYRFEEIGDTCKGVITFAKLAIDTADGGGGQFHGSSSGPGMGG